MAKDTVKRSFETMWSDIHKTTESLDKNKPQIVKSTKSHA